CPADERDINVVRVVVVDHRRAGHLERDVERVGAGRAGGHLAVERIADGIRYEGAYGAVVGAPRQRQRRRYGIREVYERHVDVARSRRRVTRESLVDRVPLPVVDRARALAATDVVADPGLALIRRGV